MPTLRTVLSAALLSTLFLGCRPDRDPVEIAKADPAKERPRLKCKDCNILFVSFDALQASHVGALGYSRDVTPTLDAVAREGFSFTNTISVSSWTVPASMTWFTGVYPSEHRMTNKFAVYEPPVRKIANLKELAPELVTLADVMKANGYATAGFTGNAGVSGGFGYEQGFDVYHHEQGRFGSMDQSIPEALKWLKENREKKFFLFLHGYDIHGQNTPARGYDYRFVDRDYDKKYSGSEQEQEALREEGLEKGALTLRASDARFWRAVYDEKIQRTDEKFKKFLAEFDRLGLTGKTLFVLTSDHGTELYEHRRFDHGFTLYNELLHVPLFIRMPGQKEGKVVADRVSSIDVMPTLLDLTQVRVSDKVQKQIRGRSLVAAMNGESVSQDVFSETDYRLYTYKRSVITPEGWKLIYTLETQSRELYNLKDDPGEMKNLAAAEPKRADELEKKLFAHFKAIGHDLKEQRWVTGLNPVYPSQAKEPPKK
jgi:choline-sulfatase